MGWENFNYEIGKKKKKERLTFRLYYLFKKKLKKTVFNILHGIQLCFVLRIKREGICAEQVKR